MTAWARRLPIVIVCAVIAALLCAAPALAVPAGWSEPVMLDSAGGAPTVAVDPAGDATAVWQEGNSDGWSESILAATRPAGGAWSAPSTLETIGLGRQVALATDRSGDAIAAWTGETGSPGNWTMVVRAAFHAANGAWSAATTLDTDVSEGMVAAAIAPGGDATVGWVVQNDTGDGLTSTNSLRVATRSAAGTWTDPTTLETAANINNIPKPSIAMDAAGDAAVAWSVIADPLGDVNDGEARVASRPAGGAWSTPDTLDVNLAYMTPVQVALDTMGDATAVWTDTDAQNTTTVQAATRPAGGLWSAPTALDTDAGHPALAEDATGRATVAWDALADSGTWSIRAASQPVGGSWSTPATVDSGGGVSSVEERPALAGDGAGDVLATWGIFDSSGSTDALRVASGSPDGAWTAAETLDGVGAGVSSALDDAGNATALWEHTDPTDYTKTGLVFSTRSALPPVAITGGPAGLVNSPDATFTFDSGVDGTHYQCQLDGSGWSACASPQSYSGLPDGDHTFDVRPYDTATAAGGTPVGQAWTIDTAPPQTTITSGPSGSTSATSVQFGFTSSEAGSTFACTVDGGLAVPCTSPQGYDGLAAGSHTFMVTATDAAGNADGTPASQAFTIVASSPGTDSGNGSGTPAGGSATDAGAGSGSNDGGYCPVNLYRSGARSRGASARACGVTDTMAPPPPCPGAYGDRGFGAFVVVAASDAGCFRDVGHHVYVSAGPVRVNGMLFTLPKGATITLDYNRNVLTTSAAPDISLAPWMDRHPWRAPGPVRWTSDKPTFTLAAPFGHDLPLELGGLRVSLPRLELASDNAGFGAGTSGATRLSVEVGVPDLFGRAPVPTHGGEPEDDQGQPALEITAETSNGNGFQWIGKFQTGPLQFGAFKVENLSATFDTTRMVFDAAGTVVLPGPAPGVAGPAVSLTTGFGLDDSGQKLRLRDFALAADNLNSPTEVPGFFLQRLHAGLGYNTNLSPSGRVGNYTLSGGGGGSFGPQIAKTSFLYKLFHTQAFISLDGDLTFGFPAGGNPWYAIVSGNGKLLNMQMADGGVELQGTGAVDIWGAFTLGLNGWGAHFEVQRGQGWYSRHHNTIQLVGTGRVGLPGLGEIDGEALVNSFGVTACRTSDSQGNPLPVGERTGFNIAWGQPIGRIDGACDVGPLTRARPAARATDTGRQVTVPAHTHLVDLAVTGQGAPPKVTVTGPHGETVATPAGATGVDNAQFTLFEDWQTTTTHVVVRDPAAGAWTVAPQPGSAPVTGVGRALGLPAPHVTGRVTCHGPRCVLRYRLRPTAGQRVVLDVLGAGATRTIATVTRRAGTVRFTPQAGVAGTRRLVATVTQGGAPRTQIVLARFHVRSGLAVAPRHLRARRAGRRVVASWSAVPGANGYTVAVRGAAQTISAFTHARHARLHMPAGRRLTVTVTAISRLGAGRAARRTVRR